MVDLKNIFIGYVKNYHTLNLTYQQCEHTFTMKEIDYFARLGSMLGYDTFTEDTIDGSHRRMDLTWWGDFDYKIAEWTTLILHLERENSIDKALETLEKLHDYDKKYKPLNRIGIIHVENTIHMNELQKTAIKFFPSEENVLLIYRIWNETGDFNDVYGFIMTDPDNPIIAAEKDLPDSDVIYMNLKNDELKKE